MDYKVFIPVLISFALCVIMGPVIIPILRRLKMGQTEREDGVKSHLKKTGTPTMERHYTSEYCDYFCVLHQGLSQNPSYIICNLGIWLDWLFG